MMKQAFLPSNGVLSKSYFVDASYLDGLLVPVPIIDTSMNNYEDYDQLLTCEYYPLRA